MKKSSLFFFIGAVDRNKLRADVQAFTGAKSTSWAGVSACNKDQTNVVSATVEYETENVSNFLMNMQEQARVRGYFMTFDRESALKVSEAWVGNIKAGGLVAYETAMYGKRV